MHLTKLILGCGLAVAGQTAWATVHLSVGGSASTNNLPLQTYESRSGNASVAFDLGRYVRLGYTHEQQIKETTGWEEDKDEAGSDTGTYTATYNKAHVIANSIDLTIVLYEGSVFVPFLVTGAVVNTYNFENRKVMADGSELVSTPIRTTVPPVPQGGLGVGVRLNRDFTLKLSYIASQGNAQEPDGEIRGVWDKKTNISLTYQL